MSIIYFVYILANKTGSVIYIGITKDLKKRAWQHREKLVDGFTKKYNLWKLVYYEIFTDVRETIEREKQLKRWSRKKKMTLIKTKNPKFIDLYEEIE